MKRAILQLLIAAVVTVALSSTASAALFIPAVNGKCIDEKGQPCVNTTIRFFDPIAGKQFTLRTDSQGRFYHPAAEPADYTVTVRRPGQADVELPPVGISFSVLPLILTIDLGKQTSNVRRQTLSFESVDVHGPMSIGSESQINNPFAKDIQDAFDRGDWEGAINRLQSAVHQDPKNAGLHALLGYAYYEAAKAKPEKSEAYMRGCVEEYSAAIAFKPEGRYYNNLGAAYVRAHRYDDAIKQFQAAEGLLPMSKNLYERNIGVTLVGESYELPEAESIAALQRASDVLGGVLAAEPQNADVMYWKGLAMLRLAAAKPGSTNYDDVANILQRYLQVAPNGRFAKDVNGMLASIRSMPRPQNQ